MTGAATTSSEKPDLSVMLLKAAWMSVVLGLGMEVILLVTASYFGKALTTQTLIADLVQKISWSTFVCTGVALGLAATKMRAAVMGFAGLIAAPMAFYIAKALHKSVSQALSISEQAAVAGPSPFLLASIKGAEYAALGCLVALLGKWTAAGLKEHALAGLMIGLLFGGAIVYTMASMAADPLPLFVLVSRAANEIIFPVGCALVLYAAQKLGQKHASKA